MATIYSVGDSVNYTMHFSSTNTYLYGHIYLTLESQSPDNKTSTVSAKLYLYKSGSSEPTTQTTFRGSVTIGGVSQSYSTYIASLGSSEQLVGTMYFTLSHATDGSFSETITTTCSYGSRPTSSVNEILNLPTISTSVSFTISPAGTLTVGTNITVAITTPDPSWTYSLSVRNTSGQQLSIFSDRSGTSITVTLPTSVSSLFPNSNSSTLYFDLIPRTSGGTILSTATIYRTVSISSSGPTISNITPTAVNAAGQTLSYGFISGVSYLKLNFTIVDNTGSTVAGVKATIDGIEVAGTINGSNGQILTQRPLGTAGTITITIVGTNARGGIGTANVTINVAAYTLPRIDNLSAIRCDSAGNAKPESTHAKITYKFAVTTNVASNRYAYYIEYRQHNTSGGWTSLKSQTNQSAASVDGSDIFLNTFNTSVMYDIRLTVRDNLTGDNGTAVRQVTLVTDQVILDFKYDGSGAAVGMLSEDSGIFDIGWAIRFAQGIYPRNLFESSNTINLNSRFPIGFYYGSTSKTAQNLPSGVSGNYGFVVLPTGVSSTLQVVIPENLNGTAKFYIRTYSTSGQVSAWREF